jgi:hypothetical protein
MSRLIVSTACLLAASVAVSTEETRYYLHGVAVQPHPVQGVILIATDGHRMMVVHDPNGYTPRDCILSMNWKAKGLKPVSRELGTRCLVVDLEENPVPKAADILKLCDTNNAERWDGGTPADVIMVTEIAGTFPQWQRVVPWKAFGLKQSAPVDLCFNPRYFAAFAPAFEILAAMDRAVLDITAYAQGEPMLITHAHVPSAFGVLMPARGEKRTFAFVDPWREQFAPKPKPEAEAA